MTSERAFDEQACLFDMTMSLRGAKDILNLKSLTIKKKQISKLNTLRHFESEIECPCKSRNSILIVDDNIFNIITVQTMIEMKFSFGCDMALNG